MFPPLDLLLEYWTEHVAIFCQIYVPTYDILQGSSRLRVWLSLWCCVPWINHLPFCIWSPFWKLGAREHTFRCDCSASGDESLRVFTTYTFLFNSSSYYSLNWRHIVMKLQDPVYYCFVNNILKHEGDILHICDDIISVEINCFRRVNSLRPIDAYMRQLN